MNSDPVTLTLPFLTAQGLTVLLVALGVFVAVGLVWLMLTGAEREKPPAPESWFTALAWVLLPVWVLLLAATLWGLWLAFSEQPSPLADTSFGLGALIAAFLGAPFVIYGTYLRHKTQRLEQEGHMTDRITAAVEQLGAEKTVKAQVRTLSWKLPESDTLYETRVRLGEQSTGPAGSIVVDPGKWDVVEETLPNLEVRMGAILSLERIAQDSTANDKGRDHVRVMEILCAYIRENSNARKPEGYPEPEWEPLKDDATEEERADHLRRRKERFGDHLTDREARQWARKLPKLRADVQLALTVIGRRSAAQRRVEAAWPDEPTDATVWPFHAGFERLPDKPGDAPLGKDALDAFKAGLDAWKEKLHNFRGYRLDLRGANLQGADIAARQPDGSDAVFSGARLGGHAAGGGGPLRDAAGGREPRGRADGRREPQAGAAGGGGPRRGAAGGGDPLERVDGQFNRPHRGDSSRRCAPGSELQFRADFR